ncbi:hypothetical protein MNV49_007133 [Pseudohyphozyma bogoriensis]|nr:hypothetical protein MNV49_007133 [Pseudohyphozyma bogoriensis]
MRVLIIGAGPAGLTTLKTLLHHPHRTVGGGAAFDPLVLECADEIGGTFDQRAYENGTLVSSKQLTAFSDFRFPLDAPDHVTMGEYVQYLKRYVVRFGLASKVGAEWDGTPLEGSSRLRLGVRVVRVDKVPEGHKVTYRRTDASTDETVTVDALAVCTGLHVLPSVPSIPGIPHNLVPQHPPVLTSDLPNMPPLSAIDPDKWEEKDGVRVIHSSQYRKRSEFKGRKVLILGCGETSMDLSYEAIQAGAKEVTVCHRGGFLSFPKVLNDFKVFGVTFDGDLPIDGLITNLFETAYVHRWVARSHIRWFISDFKSTKAMKYINKPFQPRTRFLSTFLGTEYIDPPSSLSPSEEAAAHINLALFPSSILPSGAVEFPTSPSGKNVRKEVVRMKGLEVKPDMVVFATGYRQDWDWLGEAYPRGPGDERVDVREVASREDVSVGWIGFVRPGVGAIPPIAEQQAMLWSLLLLKKIPVPTSTPTYRLLAKKTARIQYGVDHSTYMSTLAKDMGAAPSLSELYCEHGFHVLLTYCFGAAFGSFYRLTGPFKSPEMDYIVKTELWETITRRKLLGNLFMGVIPMAFYCVINALAFLLELVWIALGRPKEEWLGEPKGVAGGPVVEEKKVRWGGTTVM